MSRQQGMTLVELVIVIAILGLLLTLAVPRYQWFVLRAHRTKAAAALLRTATCQERLRADSGHYDTSLCLPTNDASYAFAYQEPPSDTALAFTVQAQPRGAQVRDPCGTLVLDETGARDVSPAGADAQACWASR